MTHNAQAQPLPRSGVDGRLERLVGRLRIAATKLGRSDEWEDLRDDLQFAAAEIEQLIVALESCEHHTHSMRIWNGQGWTYHPFQAGRIAKIARDALTPNAQP